MFAGKPKKRKVVLDFCCGAGSCAVAALADGFNVLSFDTDPRQADGYYLNVTTRCKKYLNFLDGRALSAGPQGTALPLGRLKAASEILPSDDDVILAAHPFGAAAGKIVSFFNLPSVSYHTELYRGPGVRTLAKSADLTQCSSK